MVFGGVFFLVARCLLECSVWLLGGYQGILCGC